MWKYIKIFKMLNRMLTIAWHYLHRVTIFALLRRARRINEMTAVAGNSMPVGGVTVVQHENTGARDMNSRRALRVLQNARLALSGAVLGAAVFGTLFPNALGLGAFGAAAGFAAVIAVRAAHII
jgi:hypothetical protein